MFTLLLFALAGLLAAFSTFLFFRYAKSSALGNIQGPASASWLYGTPGLSFNFV